MNTIGTPDNVLAAAVQWLQSTLLGTIATATAVIAVASIGLLLLSGRIDVRRGAEVILGCFILFGASMIAGGIARITDYGDQDAAPATAASPPPAPLYVSPAAATPAKAVPYDPYAGAALPTRR